jgi:hypothetical protein
MALKEDGLAQAECPLCLNDAESMSHLFVSCSYAGQVYAAIKGKLKAQSNWEK